MKKHSTRILLHIASIVGMYLFLDMDLLIPGFICVALVFLSLPLAMIRLICWKTYLISLALIFVCFGILEAKGLDGSKLYYLSFGVTYLIPFGVGRLKTWLTLREMNRNLEEE